MMTKAVSAERVPLRRTEAAKACSLAAEKALASALSWV
jgi:hypothetical protein